MFEYMIIKPTTNLYLSFNHSSQVRNRPSTKQPSMPLSGPPTLQSFENARVQLRTFITVALMIQDTRNFI